MSSRMNDWYIVSNGSRYAPVWPSRDGQGGIRTLDTLAGIPVFETGGFNRSPTCPARRTGWDSNPRNGCPLTRFPSVRLQPLGHPSRHNKVIGALPSLQPELTPVHLAEVGPRQRVEETHRPRRLVRLQSLPRERLQLLSEPRASLRCHDERVGLRQTVRV